MAHGSPATDASLEDAGRTVRARRSLVPLVAVLGVTSVVVAAYFDSWREVAAIWSDRSSRYSHGWMLIAASIWLLIQNLPGTLTWSSVRHRWVGGAVGVAASFVWLAAQQLSIESIAQFAALVVLAAALHAVFGREISRITDRCVAVLFFALPIWDTMNGPFQQVTIAVVGTAVRLLGLPAQLDGPFVRLPSGTFEIELGCNGLQLFLAAVTTGALLTMLRGDSWINSAKIVVGAGLIGLLANWVRVTTVIVVGHLTEMQSYLVKSEHYTLGWSLFAVGIFAYIYWVSRWPEPQRSSAGANGGTRPVRPPTAVWGVALMLIVLPVLSFAVSASPAASPRREQARFQSPEWNGPVSSWTDWDRRVEGADRFALADYVPRAGGPRVSVLLVRYASPDHVAETSLSVTGFLPAADWTPVDRTSLKNSLPAGEASSVQRTIAADPTGLKWVFVHWYQVGDRSYDSALRARLAFIAARLSGARVPFGLVVLGGACARDCEAASRSVQSLAAQSGAELIKQIAE